MTVRADLLLPALGAALVALVLAGLALHVPGAVSVGSLLRVNLFVAVLAVAAACHLAACALVLRRPGGRRTIWLVLGIAVILRLPVLAAPPFLSSDLYRYIWDGRVQQAGINPYRYIPADPALAGLRDSAIYPHINRRDYARTIYPPTAQVFFRAVAAIGQTPLAMKTAMVLCEMVAVLCLLRLLAAARLPASRVLIYAWNPLPVWCFAGNGHVDALAIALIAAALLCRGLGRDGVAGAVLAAAILVKFLPMLIAPALWRPWRRGARWRLPLAGIATVLALYGCYLGAGRQVFGFLSAYGAEEGLSRGGGVWLLAGLARLGTLPAWLPAAYFALCAMLLGGCGLAILQRQRAASPHRQRAACPERQPRQDIVAMGAGAGLLAAAGMLLLSPHYPWYFPFLGIFAILSPSRCVIWMSVAPLVLYLSPWHEFFLWPSLIYLPALALAARDLQALTRPRPLALARNAS